MVNPAHQFLFVGSIPDTWKSVRVDGLAQLSRYNISQDQLADTKVYHYSIPVVQQTGTGAYEDGDTIDSSKTLIKEETLLISKLNPRKGTIVLASPQDVITVCSGEFVPLLANKVLPKYLEYVFRSESIRQLLASRVESATRSHQRVNPSVITKLWWLWPSRDEQERLIQFLDVKTTQIDALILKKMRQIELLKEKRSALITEAVTKGLDPKVKMKDTGVEWLGEMPEHWEIIRVKRAGAIRYGLGQPPNELDEGLPLIRATDLHAGVIDTQTMLYVDPDDIPWSKNPLLYAGEIIVVRSGAYTGDSAIIPKSLEGSIAGYDMVVTPTTCDPLFLSYYFLSDFFLLWQLKPETLRAAQPHLNAEELGSFLVFRPPSDEQVKIGEWLENKLSQIKNLTEQLSKSIELLIELRSSLISEAVTGKLSIGETS